MFKLFTSVQLDPFHNSVAPGVDGPVGPLPPMANAYDDSFVEQLREFIPHLEELRFNGGEPFAQKIVYDICMLVADINPSLRINIATNGTVYNKQVREILEKCNIHLNISIDSLDKEDETIIVNADQIFNSNLNTFMCVEYLNVPFYTNS